MGMQVHFDVAEIPEGNRIHKHKDKMEDDALDIWYDYYIVVDPAGHYFNTDNEYKSAWFDIGQMSDSGMAKLKWLIQNRICFNAS